MRRGADACRTLRSACDVRLEVGGGGRVQLVVEREIEATLDIPTVHHRHRGNRRSPAPSPRRARAAKRWSGPMDAPS